MNGKEEQEKEWTLLPVDCPESCTAAITLFTVEDLKHRSVMSKQPMACDLKFTYSLNGLGSRTPDPPD